MKFLLPKLKDPELVTLLSDKLPKNKKESDAKAKKHLNEWTDLLSITKDDSFKRLDYSVFSFPPKYV